MSLEVGGRADKYGNQYENRWLATLLLRMVNETISSIEVEPLGPDGDGVEFIVTLPDDTLRYYQCKASSGTVSSWSMYDLHKLNVFKRSQEHILRKEKSSYHFISPLKYQELDELCKRARTCPSPEALHEYQLTNKKIRDVFNDCASYFELNPDNPEELNQLVYLLSHSWYETVQDGHEAVLDLEERIGFAFSGRTSSTRVLLEQFANDNGLFGVKITVHDVVSRLEKEGVFQRTMGFDSRVLPRLKAINEIYWDVYQPINSELFHRKETEFIIQSIVSGHSVVLHGRAGAGKSGCIQELISHFKNEHIPYLAIKLDKHIPQISADKYGESLGFPCSPVFCVNSISGKQPCVIILDQLDSLRWTNAHSAIGLAVCKEMIAQAEAINKNEGGKISLVFVVRTFDYETDSSIRNLFSERKDDGSIRWDSINVKLLSDDEVKAIVGKGYANLPDRVKKMLQTPSTLYVWEKLNPGVDKTNVSTVTQLMETWWRQIIQNCESIGLQTSEIQQHKNSLVSLMDEQSLLSIPSIVFSDDQKIIDALISGGLLQLHDSKISFSHQSFFDYFLVQKAVSEVYKGGSIMEFLGEYDSQTPNLRYRLLMMLQNLLESNERVFLDQSRKILEADNIRYYFKCTVFEVIGQIENPDPLIQSFVKPFFYEENWHEYVITTVFMGHPEFVKLLVGKKDNYSWLSDEGLRLLKSISSKAPDFVTDVLRPFCFSDSAFDKKIYWALCHDILDDSEAMFALRMQLMEQHIDLLAQSWSFYTLFEKQSDYAIPILKLMIQRYSSKDLANMHFPEEKVLKQYSLVHHSRIIKELFPEICLATASYTHQYDYDFHDWCASNHNESAIRKAVCLVRYSLRILAELNPTEFFESINSFNRSKSVIEQEIIIYAMTHVPNQFSDSALQWLLSDLGHNAFEHSSGEKSSLSCCEGIIEKYSPTCSDSVFKQLEYAICNWRIDVERMISIYKHRRETNAERNWEPVYYAYWGHFQKVLLPALDPKRTSVYTKQLIGVLNRNQWISESFYDSGICVGMAKFVCSPVHGYAEKLSDKRWLNIISTPNLNREHRGGWKEKDDCYVEATHEQFSGALATAAKNNPMRFASLSFSFPENTYSGYISAVLGALKEKVNDNEYVDINLSSDVLRKFWSSKSDFNIATEGIRLIRDRYTEDWPKDILNQLFQIALTHPHPAKSEYPVTSSGDPEHNNVSSLRSNSINCVRGCALDAIASLLWEHKNLSDFFKPCILSAMTDLNPSVRFSVVSCTVAYYNTDRAFAEQVFLSLLEQDLRILSAPQAWEIFYRVYDHNQDYFQRTLISAFLSDIEDLAECAAGIICAIAIYKGDMLQFLFDESLPQKQAERVCQQAAYCFANIETHEISKAILSHLIDSCSYNLDSFSRLFYDKCIDIHWDQAFLIQLMKSTHSAKLLHTFLDYLHESDEDISHYALVLKAIGESIYALPSDRRLNLVVGDLIKCIIRLFDRCQDDIIIKNICLDIWDNLFKSNIRDIKPISDMIDDVI